MKVEVRCRQSLAGVLYTVGWLVGRSGQREANARGLRNAALLHTADVRSVYGGCASCMPGVLAGHSPLVAEVLDLCCKASRELCSVKTVDLLDTADTIQQPATHQNTHNTQEQPWAYTSGTNCLCMHAATDSTTAAARHHRLTAVLPPQESGRWAELPAKA